MQHHKEGEHEHGGDSRKRHGLGIGFDGGGGFSRLDIGIGFDNCHKYTIWCAQGFDRNAYL